MSELQSLLRQFGDQIKTAEDAQAAALGEIAGGIVLTVEDIHRRMRTALAHSAEGVKMVQEAAVEMAAILEDEERAFLSIRAEIEKMREVKASSTGRLHLIAGGKTETGDGTNG